MELSPAQRRNEHLGDRILKVNHAGEHGAINIYAGQMLVARWTAPSVLAELAEFRSHEQHHRSIFEAELQRRGVRRCRSYVACGVGGYVLGFLTALFGRGAIAATTVAIERVVLVHLKHQLSVLQGRDEAAVAAIRSIVDEEQEHHDRFAAHAQASPIWLKLLSPIVGVSTESVIWLGMRL